MSYVELQNHIDCLLYYLRSDINSLEDCLKDDNLIKISIKIKKEIDELHDVFYAWWGNISF